MFDAGDDDKLLANEGQKTSANAVTVNNMNGEKRVEMQDLMRWKHLDPKMVAFNNESLQEDPILKDALKYLSYVFKNEVCFSNVS